jgi:cold shock CspA family protein
MQEVGSNQIGNIKWYSIAKSYGFISRNGDEDIFFHHASIVSDNIGACAHVRGICSRAISLMSEPKRKEAIRRQENSDLSTPKLESMLKGERVTFRIFQTARGFEARSVKRAT